jgi:hypothetical protein
VVHQDVATALGTDQVRIAEPDDVDPLGGQIGSGLGHAGFVEVSHLSASV